MADHPEDQLKLLQQRLDRLEDLIQVLIQRTHALEKWAFPSAELRSSTGILHTPQVPLPKVEDAEPRSRIQLRQDGERSRNQAKIVGDSCVCRLSARVAGVNHRRQCFEQVGMVAILLGMSYFLKYYRESLIGEKEGDHWYPYRVGFPGLGRGPSEKKISRLFDHVQGGGIAISFLNICQFL
jgi:hypothetical protein